MTYILNKALIVSTNGVGAFVRILNRGDFSMSGAVGVVDGLVVGGGVYGLKSLESVIAERIALLKRRRLGVGYGAKLELAVQSGACRIQGVVSFFQRALTALIVGIIVVLYYLTRTAEGLKTIFSVPLVLKAADLFGSILHLGHAMMCVILKTITAMVPTASDGDGQTNGGTVLNNGLIGPIRPFAQ